MKKLFLAESADATRGRFKVITVSVSGPTDISGSNQYNFRRRYETVLLVFQTISTFSSFSLKKSKMFTIRVSEDKIGLCILCTK